MEDKVSQCLIEAAKARWLAKSASGTAARDHWLKIAEAWEELAAEYRRLDELEKKTAPKSSLT